jgi:hypothetical protein
MDDAADSADPQGEVDQWLPVAEKALGIENLSDDLLSLEVLNLTVKVDEQVSQSIVVSDLQRDTGGQVPVFTGKDQFGALVRLMQNGLGAWRLSMPLFSGWGFEPKKVATEVMSDASSATPAYEPSGSLLLTPLGFGLMERLSRVRSWYSNSHPVLQAGIVMAVWFMVFCLLMPAGAAVFMTSIVMLSWAAYRYNCGEPEDNMAHWVVTWVLLVGSIFVMGVSFGYGILAAE